MHALTVTWNRVAVRYWLAVDAICDWTNRRWLGYTYGAWMFATIGFCALGMLGEFAAIAISHAAAAHAASTPHCAFINCSAVA